MIRKKILPAAAVLLCLAAFVGLMIRSAEKLTVTTAAEVRQSRPFVLIDPGHGGEDGGAVAGGVLEKTINLAVSHDTADLLRLCGYEVSMTRNGDNALTDEGEDVRKRKYNDMKMRLDLYNAPPAARRYFIHPTTKKAPRWQNACAVRLPTCCSLITNANARRRARKYFY